MSDAPRAGIVFLPVRDLERADAFYAGTLGLSLVLDQGGCRIYRVAAGSYIGCCRRAEVPSPAGLVVTIVAQDVAGWHRRLVDHGAWTDGPPRVNDQYGIEHFFTRDPDGWSVEIQRFLDSNWESGGDAA